jgi:hypothetical protein
MLLFAVGFIAYLYCNGNYLAATICTTDFSTTAGGAGTVYGQLAAAYC